MATPSAAEAKRLPEAQSAAGTTPLNGENPFFRQHFIEVAAVESREALLYLFHLADVLTQMKEQRDPLLSKMLELFTVAVLFYEQSSRTYGSFVAAAKNLGATAIDIHGANAVSSAVKGETHTDAASVAAHSWGADVLVQRHPLNSSSIDVVAELERLHTEMRVVNAGSGTKEHPSQALLDAYTIFQKYGRIDDLNIVMVGDMLNGRTVKSLGKLLAHLGENISVTLVSPEALKMPFDEVEKLRELGATVVEASEFSPEILAGAQVVYWTRVQKERFESTNAYEEVKDAFILTPELAAQFNSDCIFMHPLPRVNEIETPVDTDPRAVYLEAQMGAGLSVRMALLVAMLVEQPFAKIAALRATQEKMERAVALYAALEQEFGPDLVHQATSLLTQEALRRKKMVVLPTEHDN